MLVSQLLLAATIGLASAQAPATNGTMCQAECVPSMEADTGGGVAVEDCFGEVGQLHKTCVQCEREYSHDELYPGAQSHGLNWVKNCNMLALSQAGMNWMEDDISMPFEEAKAANAPDTSSSAGASGSDAFATASGTGSATGSSTGSVTGSSSGSASGSATPSASGTNSGARAGYNAPVVALGIIGVVSSVLVL